VQNPCDTGVNLLPAPNVLQLGLGIAHHEKAPIPTHPAYPMEYISAVASGIQHDIASLDGSRGLLQISRVAV
jgi:hypothetical protein